MPRAAPRRPLPQRYQQEWGAEFWARVNRRLVPGVSILDVGAGRRPTISPDERPRGTEYVGLDISESELKSSPPGSYDEAVAADAHSFVPALADRFDLILAWQVMEHFRDLRVVASVLHRYARPGGDLVAHFSGRNAVYALGNRVLPPRVGRRLTHHLMRRPIDTIFPAYYDRCDARQLPDAFADWDSLEVIPFWRGADYFARLPPLLGAYLRYEDWSARNSRDNLATHYCVTAHKAPDDKSLHGDGAMRHSAR
jgi:SAM-dependent methyltransferase